METIIKLVALIALVIGILALERTWKIPVLQRRVKELTSKLEKTRESNRITAELAAERIDRFIQKSNDTGTAERKKA